MFKSKYEKLIQKLEDAQDKEFAHYGKSDYFTFLEDVIGETKDLYQRWIEINGEEDDTD
jgi:hypothetical protein